MKKFEFLGDALCLDFLNTLHHAGAEDPGEDLSSDADLAGWAAQAGGAEKIFYAIVKSAAELMATGRWRAVRECASDTCTWMFLDTSKNHSRRWCEMARCGNRDKVHRFRARSRRARPRKAVRP